MGLKLIRKPKSPNVQKRVIRQEVISKLKPVAIATRKSFEKVVDNWSNKPQFKEQITVTADRIEIEIVVRRGKRLPGKNQRATTADLWKWIDETGTKAHPIRPTNRGGVLRFNWGGPGSYQSKTGARPARSGGPGRVVRGETTYRKSVQHPGFPPRKFSEAIGKDLLPTFRKAVDSGYRSALKKAKQ